MRKVGSHWDAFDRLILCAGLGGHVDDHARVASVNYFGVTDLLDWIVDKVPAPAVKSMELPGSAVSGIPSQLPSTLTPGPTWMISPMRDGSGGACRKRPLELKRIAPNWQRSRTS